MLTEEFPKLLMKILKTFLKETNLKRVDLIVSSMELIEVATEVRSYIGIWLSRSQCYALSSYFPHYGLYY
jgi:hypothetical protein